MLKQDGTRGRPVFAARRVGDGGTITPHRTVLCGGGAVALDACHMCTSYQAIDLTTPGGPRVRCDVEDLAAVPDLDGEAITIPVVAIMRRKTTCIAPDADLEAAEGLLVELELGGLVVVDTEHRPLGMVTVADLARPRGPEALRVRDVMTQFALIVTDRTTVAHVAALMAEESVHRLPVVAHDGRLVGVVTALDVMGWIARKAGLRTPR